MPLPDARVLLERLAGHARAAGAAYLEARALELGGGLEVDSRARNTDEAGDVPQVVVEDPADQPTDVLPAPDLRG
jgi:hypothetical protein